MSENPVPSSLSPGLRRYLLEAEFHESYTLQQIKGGNGESKPVRWDKARSLGRGAFGQVRQEKSKDDNGDWHYRAVKVCVKETLEHARVDFIRELSALAALSSSKHSGLFVNLLGWWFDSQSLYIATEYVGKGDLSNYVHQKLQETEAKEIVEGILHGLQVMHQEGFTHRDIKPQNILVAQKPPEFQKWWVKIADFGISKRILGDNDTVLHTSLGTRFYCAPEILGYLPQSQDTSVYSNKVDIWSLGCVLFNISSHGHTPFSDHELLRYCYGDVQFNPKDKQLYLGSQGICLLQKCLLPDPDHRPSAANALKDQWFISELDFPHEDVRIFDRYTTQRVIEHGNQNQNAQENYNSFLQFTSRNHAEPSIYPPNPSGSQPESSEPIHESAINKNIFKGNATVQLSRFTDGESPVNSVAFSPDGRLVASGSTDMTVRLWDIATGQPRRFKGHAAPVSAVAFSPDGRLVASGSRDSTVRLWDVATGRARRFEGHKGPINAVAFSPDGRLVTSGSNDRTLRLWDVATGLAQRLKSHAAPVCAVAFSPDGRLVASGSIDKTIKFLDILKRVLRRTIVGHAAPVSAVAFSPDGQLLASGSSDNTIGLWDVATGRARRMIKVYTDIVTTVAFSPDGQLVASGSKVQNIKLWDVATGQAQRTIEGHTEHVRAVAFSPDGRLLVSGSNDKTVRLWDVTAEQSSQ